MIGSHYPLIFRQRGVFTVNFRQIPNSRVVIPLRRPSWRCRCQMPQAGAMFLHQRALASVQTISARINEKKRSSLPNQRQTIHSDRFDTSKNETEWRSLTKDLLDPNVFPMGSLPIDQFVEAIQATRWWISTRKTSESISAALQLINRLAVEVHLNPKLLNTEDLNNWYTGRYPRARHLLNAILDTWKICWRDSARSSKGKQLPSPEQILQRIDALPGLEPDCRSYSIIMTAAISSGSLSNSSGTERRHSMNMIPIFCEDVLNRMLERGRTNPAALPDNVAFTTVLNAWAQSGRPDAAERANVLWINQVQLFDAKAIDAQPTTVTYNTFLHALTRAPLRVDNLERAEELLQDMLTSPYAHVYPDTVSYRLIIFGWAAMKNSSSIDRAYRLLKDMVNIHETMGFNEKNSNNKEIFDFDVSFFSKLISTAALSVGDYKAAEKIFQYLEEVHQRTGDPRFQMDARVARSMIVVYAKTDRPALAEKLLDFMEQEAARCNDSSMLPKRSYGEVLFAWTQSEEDYAAEHAQDILLRMFELESKGNLTMKPTKGAVNGVLKKWSQSRRKDAAPKAEALLRFVQELHVKTTHAIKLEHEAFQHVLVAWAWSSSREAGERAEGLLLRMERDNGLKPNRVHFATAIKAWTATRRPEAAKHSQEIFERAINSFKVNGNHPDYCPDNVLYCAIITAHAIACDGEQAERHLQIMLEDYQNGNPMAKPETEAFNLVLTAWLRSKGANAPNRAEGVFRTMQSLTKKGTLDAHPNERSYSLMCNIMSNAKAGLDECAKRSKYYARELQKYRSSGKSMRVPAARKSGKKL